MPWNQVVGQERVVDLLRRSIAADRVAHAYLFHGPEGSGKRVVALAFAQALQCERRAQGTADACGDCGPCGKVARMVHPDVQVHLALPRTHQRSSTGEPGNAQIQDVVARVQLLAADPYAEVGYRRRPDLKDPAKASNLQLFYTVERVRKDINHSLRYSPAEGRYKIVILTDADTLGSRAGNALLKSLEEPNKRTVLILTTTRPDALLPTIVSRCQRVRFDVVAVPEIERALIDRAAASPEQAPLIARMADGSVTQALGLAADESLAERRDTVLRFLRLALRPTEELDELVKVLAGIGREPLRDFFGLMLSWLRDAILMSASNGQAELVNVDQRDTITRFVDNLAEARLEDMVAQVEQAVSLVAGNVNTTLILLNLAEGLRQAMNGVRRTRLFTPLVG